MIIELYTSCNKSIIVHFMYLLFVVSLDTGPQKPKKQPKTKMKGLFWSKLKAKEVIQEMLKNILFSIIFSSFTNVMLY
jgi:hypothetical protein